MVISLFAVVIGITGKFVGQNELECTDGAGNVETLTSRNFIIAVGGRPTPLECIGGELAISSDDLFSMVKEITHLHDHIYYIKLPSQIRSKSHYHAVSSNLIATAGGYPREDLCRRSRVRGAGMCGLSERSTPG